MQRPPAGTCLHLPREEADGFEVEGLGKEIEGAQVREAIPAAGECGGVPGEGRRVAGDHDYSRGLQGGKFGGYDPLVADVIKFFKTGKVPVPAQETIEIFAFMSAADESKAKGGCPVNIKDVIAKAKAGK